MRPIATRYWVGGNEQGRQRGDDAEVGKLDLRLEVKLELKVGDERRAATDFPRHEYPLIGHRDYLRLFIFRQLFNDQELSCLMLEFWLSLHNLGILAFPLVGLVFFTVKSECSA